jgi:hypothetical protein
MSVNGEFVHPLNHTFTDGTEGVYCTTRVVGGDTFLHRIVVQPLDPDADLVHYIIDPAASVVRFVEEVYDSNFRKIDVREPAAHMQTELILLADDLVILLPTGDPGPY